MKIILASKSPRRHELLKKIINDFEIVASDFDERNIEFLGDPFDYVKKLAYSKALEIAKENKDSLVIGMDTIVYLENEILHKPINEDDARNMMKKMANKEHLVVTGVCLLSINNNIEVIDYEKTLVKFSCISDQELDRYIEKQDFWGKAGSYAIQGEASKFIEKINGDFYNVVGLPIAKTYKLIKKLL